MNHAIFHRTYDRAFFIDPIRPMSGPKAGGAFVVSGATSAVNSIDTCSILYILPLTTCRNK